MQMELHKYCTLQNVKDWIRNGHVEKYLESP